MYGIIATWCMALNGVNKANDLLKNKQLASKAIEEAIKDVEDFPYYKSVGYGGLPNEDEVVELDSGYMDGDTLSVGAIGAIKDFANPISIAKALSKEKVNNVLVSYGAEKYARTKGFIEKEMLTDRAKAFYNKKKKELENEKEQTLKPYDGHDTVGVVCLDNNGSVISATSTSGLFMKKSGRVGDSPLVGSGFYADSEVGGATATGLGEDLFKGCISYEIVRLMSEGLHPQVACEKAIYELDKKLREKRGEVGDLSVVALNNRGEFGAASNIDGFSFVCATNKLPPTVYVVNKMRDGHCGYNKASQEWLDNYTKIEMIDPKE